MSEQSVSPPPGFPVVPPVWNAPGSLIGDVAPPGPGPFGGVSPPAEPPRPLPGTEVVDLGPAYARRRHLIGGLLAVIGGALLVLGSLMNWVRANLPGIGSQIGSGWHNVRGHVSHGPWIAALALVAAVLGAVMVTGVRHAVVKGVAVGAAVIAAGFVLFEIYDISNPGEGVSASIQAGIWVMVVGAASALVGTLLTTSRPPH